MSVSLGLMLPRCQDCKHFLHPTPPLHSSSYGKCARLQFANIHASDKREHLYAIIARDFDCLNAKFFERRR